GRSGGRGVSLHRTGALRAARRRKRDFRPRRAGAGSLSRPLCRAWRAHRRHRRPPGLDCHRAPHRPCATGRPDRSLRRHRRHLRADMPLLSQLSFGAPLVLLGLLVLPVLWWLLRVTPPSPRPIAFPPLRLLRGLVNDEETPANTP